MLGMIIPPGIKVKVTVATLKKNCQYPSLYIYKWILIYLNPIVVYYNISSKIEFQGAGFKVKVSIYRKKTHFVMALMPTFIDGF